MERIIIPETLRGKILKVLHEGHPGIAAIKTLTRYYICDRTVTKIFSRLWKSVIHTKRTEKMNWKHHYSPGIHRPNHGHESTWILEDLFKKDNSL
ncbi:Uncharacterized protein TSPI_08173 [Trichinella spiralis]|uniref:Integrase zinc-binding domain-containing protein n=1 Tax=Trichinella spiralis TaxID=6334 RepID=A0ABR3KHX9_TRISP